MAVPTTAQHEGGTPASRVRAACQALRAGEPVLLVEGGLPEHGIAAVAAGSILTTDAVRWLAHRSGAVVGAAACPVVLGRIGVVSGGVASTTRPQVVASLDLCGASSARSPEGHAALIRRLAEPSAVRADFESPGLVPVISTERFGLLQRRGYAEAAVDLLRMAGLPPVSAIASVDPNGRRWESSVVRIDIADVLRRRMRLEPVIAHMGAARIPTADGDLLCVAYRSLADARETVAMVVGSLPVRTGAAVRVHQSCVVGDLVAGCGCGCGARLRHELARLRSEGCGALVYVQTDGATKHPWRRGRSVLRPLDRAVVKQIAVDLRRAPASGTA